LSALSFLSSHSKILTASWILVTRTMLFGVVLIERGQKGVLRNGSERCITEWAMVQHQRRIEDTEKNRMKRMGVGTKPARGQIRGLSHDSGSALRQEMERVVWRNTL
jgi:hypothetical protein